MTPLRGLFLLLPVLGGLLAVSPAAGVTPPSGPRPAEFAPPSLAARAPFRTLIPAEADARGRFSALPDEATAVRNAREFLSARASLLLTDPASTVLQTVRRGRGKWAVRFRQEIDGVPVLGATAFVLLHDSGRVAAYGSTFLPAEAPPRAVLTDADALRIAAASVGGVPRADRPVETEHVLSAVRRGEDLVLGPVWIVTFSAEEPFGRWRTVVDAETGEILGRSDEHRYVDVFGTVTSSAELLGACFPTTSLPGALLEVEVVGSGTGVTDAAGNFSIPHAGALPVLVSSELKGPYVDVNRAPGLGPDAVFLGPATPGLPVQIAFGPANSRRDERNTFHLTNAAHAFIQAIDPTLTALDTSMPVNVGRIDVVCPGNAWWDGVAMNFCDSSLVHLNTGRSDTIIFHEYGHAVTMHLYRRNGILLSSPALDEGNSDVFANFISRSPILAKGYFLGDCNSFLRDSENLLQWPDDLQGGTGHADGRILAAFHWDAWQALLSSRPQRIADSIAWHSWHEARDLGVPQDMPEQVLWTFLADDDDGNLANGTPNFSQICGAARAHGFACPEPLPAVLITHDRLPHITDGTTPVEIRALVESPSDMIDPATVVTEYRVDGGPFQTLPMFPTGAPDEYVAALPVFPDIAEVEYYVFAKDVQDCTGTSPAAAPAQLHAFDVAWLLDKLETAAGWIAGDPADDAATGAWGHVDPVGTIAQPEDDASAGPTDRMCFVTGQCGTGHGTCWVGCNLGCNDVDGGTTTLYSPVWDLTGATTAVLKYDRWYSNDRAANPGEDFWRVDVSNDGGASWSALENTTASSNAWQTQRFDLQALFGTPGFVRLRFRAEDLLSPSLVEAGVDDVRLLVRIGGSAPTEAAAVTPGAPLALALAQNHPNPFRPGTRIEYSVPRETAVGLAIYDVRGRMVRRLADGIRPAGRYSVRWDGTDAAGTRVAPGVYFYRLTSAAGNLTRKLTVSP